MQYDALLFDVDGVLLERTSDDRAAFERAIRAAFADHGVDEPDPEHVADLVYGVTPEYLREVCARYDLDAAAFWRAGRALLAGPARCDRGRREGTVPRRRGAG
jgi:phosphoglycolate phosphatase-like HAD superfamily hydrolase